jgi:hypothetical protein
MEAAVQKQAATPTTITLPALAEGEKYAGFLLDEHGVPTHHVILLAGDTSAPWKKALEWAKKQGGELPTRREQSLLFANCKAEFKEDWYWSGEQRADAGCAWCQDFSDGYQGWGDVSDRARARAVRRVPIQ